MAQNLLIHLSLVAPFLTFSEFIQLSISSKQILSRVRIDKSSLDYWNYYFKQVVFCIGPDAKEGAAEFEIEEFQRMSAIDPDSSVVSIPALLSLFHNEASLSDLSMIWKSICTFIAHSMSTMATKSISEGKQIYLLIKHFCLNTSLMVHYFEPTTPITQHLTSPILVVLYIYVLHMRSLDTKQPIDHLSRRFLMDIASQAMQSGAKITVKLHFTSWGVLGFFRGRDVPTTKYYDLGDLIDYICTLHTAEKSYRPVHCKHINQYNEDIEADLEESPASVFLSKISSVAAVIDMSGVPPATITIDSVF